MPATLKPLEILPYYLKELKEEDKPYYTEADKRIIAFCIAFQGTISIYQLPRQTIAYINLSSTDYELLANFTKIVKLGHTSKSKKPQKPHHKPKKVWEAKTLYEVFFILEQLKGFMPCDKYRRLRQIVSEFCKLRIEAHRKGKREAPRTERELQIIREVRILNKRGI